jgi:peptidoglycan/LPS O-acetylase OafA/YrhL
MNQPDGLPRSSSYLPELESLRGWAILSVVVFHYFGLLTHGKMGAGPGAPLWMQLGSAGNTGVTLFFVLSGFLLSRPFLENLQKGRPTSIRRFYVARLLRILPLYYVVVTLAWILTHAATAPKAYLFIRIGFDAHPFSVPWWTLTLEMQFYLLLPWAMLLLTRRAGRWVLGALLTAWLVAHLYYIHRPGWELWTNPWLNTFFDRGTGFVIGALGAAFYLTPVYRRFALSRAAVWSTALVSIAGLLYLLRFYGIEGQFDALKKFPLFHDVEATLYATLIVSSVALTAAWKILYINPVADHFGRISYSLYLFHVPAQYYVMQSAVLRGENLYSARNLGMIGVSFGIAWAVSVLSYQFIEKPFLKLKSRVPVRAERPAEARSAA